VWSVKENTTMALSLPVSLKSGVLMLVVCGTAAGLNLSVMGLGADTSEPPEQIAMEASAPTDPEVIRVVVDVPIPAAESSTNSSDLVVAPAAAPTAASPAPVRAPAAVKATTAAPQVVSTTLQVTTTAAPSTTATPPTTATPATAAPTIAPTAQAPATTVGPVTEYLTYSFDGVAEIIVAYHDGRSLEFWSAVPEPGWAFMVEKDSPDKVEIKFRREAGGEGEAKFAIKREDGELEVKTER
jgi:hypothetical protein